VSSPPAGLPGSHAPAAPEPAPARIAAADPAALASLMERDRSELAEFRRWVEELGVGWQELQALKRRDAQSLGARLRRLASRPGPAR
jgi:hypothetical protein